MSVLRMLPDQVAEQWGIIRCAVEECLPNDIAEDEIKISNILTSLMSGEMHCWVVANDLGESSALILTTFTYDPTGSKSLCVYALYGYQTITKKMWDEMVDSGVKWARGNGCTTFTMYTVNQGIVDIMKRFGANVQQFLTIEV